MSADAPEKKKDAPSPAARMGRRIGTLAVAFVAVPFIVSSAYQIIVALFELAPSHQAPPAACVAGIRSLAGALDEASSKATREIDQASAKRVFDQSLTSAWSGSDDTEKTCSSTPEGAEAFASLARLRRAHEDALFRRANDVDRLHQALEARLDPR